MTVWVKSGTYTLTTTTKGAAGPCNMEMSNGLYEGYNATREDLRTTAWATAITQMPEINAGAQTSVILFNRATAGKDRNVIRHFRFDGNAGATNTGCFGQNNSLFHRCYAENCTTAGFSTSLAVQCVATACGSGFSLGHAVACVSYSNTTHGFVSLPAVVGCVAYSNGDDGFNGCTGCYNCTAYANTDDGFSSITLQVNCHAQGHSGASDAGYSGNYASVNCSSYNNTVEFPTQLSGRRFGAILNAAFSGDPLVDAAGGDFRPDATAGEGALLRSTGAGPLTQTNAVDIGAVQHADPAGGAATTRAWASAG
jgi:hypothetical protein